MMHACLGKRKDDCSGTETEDWPPAYTQLNLKVCPAFFCYRITKERERDERRGEEGRRGKKEGP